MNPVNELTFYSQSSCDYVLGIDRFVHFVHFIHREGGVSINE